MNELLNFPIQDKLCLFSFAFLGALFIRLIISSIEAWDRGKDWFWPVFLGYGKKIDCIRVEGADRLLGFFIGFLELVSYPILIIVNLPEYVGAWLVFKTVNRWNYKSQNRGLFNRYLFANALILVFSYLFARFIKGLG